MADPGRSCTSGALRAPDVACRLVSDLDVEAVLERVLEAAPELTGDRYAALGILDHTRSRLQRFISRARCAVIGASSEGGSGQTHSSGSTNAIASAEPAPISPAMSPGARS